MGYQIIDTATDLNKYIYDDSHVTLYATFMYSGTPVDVTNPSFTLKDNDTGQPVSVTLLKPLQKDTDTQNVVGKYIVTFLTTGLSAGKYDAEFSGTYNAQDVNASSTVDLFEQPRTQYLIDLLRGSLGGKYNIHVPRQFMTFDPIANQWSDGALYQALERSLNAINCIPPITDFNYDSIPCVNYLIIGAQIYALTDITTLEDVNYFDITIPVKVTLYRGEKFKALLQFLKDQFQQPVFLWKQHWWFENESDSIAVVMKRVPIRLLRPVSDNLFFHSLAY